MPCSAVHRRVLLSLLGAALIGLAGCASSSHRVGAEERLGDVRAPEGVVESGVVAARPEAPTRRRFISFDGERTLVRDSEPTPDLDSWRMEERIDGESEPRLVEHYARAPNGRVVLTRSFDHVEGVVTWFDPPLVVLPASLSPGETFRQTLTLRVYPIADQGRLQDQGEAEQEITFEGVQRIVTHRGAVDAALVREAFRVSLSAAKVERTTERWYSRDTADGAAAGLVGERWEQVVRFLGLPVRSQGEAWTLDRRD